MRVGCWARDTVVICFVQVCNNESLPYYCSLPDWYVLLYVDGTDYFDILVTHVIGCYYNTNVWSNELECSG